MDIELMEFIGALPTLPIIGRANLDDATMLFAQLGGEDASAEAAMRADRSRDIGNLYEYCRWRQIERAIAILSLDEAIGTVH